LSATEDVSSGTDAESSYFDLERYNSTNGTLDSSFGDGTGLTATAVPNGASAVAMALEPNGDIVVAGNDGSGGIILMRFTSGGELDPTFGTDGVVDDGMMVDSGSDGDFASSVAILGDPWAATDPSDWQIVVAGMTTGRRQPKLGVRRSLLGGSDHFDRWLPIL
jgi:hypothetical protein